MPRNLLLIGALAPAIVAWTWCGACVPGPCPVNSICPTCDPNERSAELYVGHGDPYELGPLAVRRIEVARCEQAAPLPLLIHTPEQAGSYAVVVFQHGFLARNYAYSGILRHVASHGFVVVAPQMYDPGLVALFGNPSADEEAAWAADVLDWLPGHLDVVAGVTTRVDVLGLAGHSRGGKVAWLVLSNDPSRARAVAGVDPVDGTGGPLGGQARVVQGPFGFDFPSLVIGTGLGGACAPEGDNHVQFYEASASPAWHVVAVDAGHGDMLDENSVDSRLLGAVCQVGPDRPGMLELTAGLLVAFFRGALLGDEASFGYLTDTEAAPIAVDVESK
ncbi:MAG: dienelactone hydrolase family protein [Phycisphaerae bacterium]|nr:dienelactone hydrolase family protein [Phycisphaerae bacterium]